MKMILISKKVLPDDWIEKVKNFDIDQSNLPTSLKPLCHKIKQNIINEKEDSATSYFNQPFIEHICLNEKWELDIYEELPLELIEEIFCELGSEKGIQYDTKLYSLFSELYAYKYLVSQGYQYKEFERSPGSCDLILQKGCAEYNCEVKLKKSEDNHHTRILFFIKGKACLPEYKNLRKIDTVFYKIIEYPNGYREIENMYKEIESFCKKPNTLYKGEYIELSSVKLKPQNPNDYLIRQHTENTTTSLIEKILTGENRHITKLIEKSQKYDNFIGYLSLDIPFYDDIKRFDLEDAFKSLEMDFKLYVNVNGVGIEAPYVLEIN